MADDITHRNEQTVEALFRAMSGKTPDYGAVASVFADDAYYWALTPVSPQRVGPQAIVDDLKRQFAMAGDLESKPPYAVVSSGNRVVLEREDFVTVVGSGKRASVRICAVFEFNDAGRITAWREYFDQAYCLRQMGIAGSDYSKTPETAG